MKNSISSPSQHNFPLIANGNGTLNLLALLNHPCKTSETISSDFQRWPTTPLTISEIRFLVWRAILVRRRVEGGYRSRWPINRNMLADVRKLGSKAPKNLRKELASLREHNLKYSNLRKKLKNLVLTDRYLLWYTKIASAQLTKFEKFLRGGSLKIKNRDDFSKSRNLENTRARGVPRPYEGGLYRHKKFDSLRGFKKKKRDASRSRWKIATRMSGHPPLSLTRSDNVRWFFGGCECRKE